MLPRSPVGWRGYDIWEVILRKLTEIVATRCQILRLKCTKIDFCWGTAPDPTGGAYSAPPDPLAGIKIPYF